MTRPLRIVLLYLSTGIIWCGCMRLFFVVSGAQQILADPHRQSSKFIKAFIEYKPLPRMAMDPMIVWKGFFICGLFAATAFLFVNRLMKGSWLKRGVAFGLLHWALMTPWFEFYLPYNVMNEPFSLVLFETILWLCTLVATGIYMSAVINLYTRAVHSIDERQR